MLRTVILTATVLAMFGCGPETPSKQFSSAELAALAASRLKAVADDKSLGDAESFKKYFDTHPSKPAVILPPSIGAWWELKSEADGHWLTLRDIDHPITRGESVEGAEKGVRNVVKAKAGLAKQVLEHFQPRNLKGITIQLFTPITGAEGYTEAFRTLVAPADLPKLETATGAADAGSEFDPRGPRIGELWKVELNRYPEIEYKKKS